MLVHPQQVTEDDNSPPTNTAAHMNLDHFNVIVVGQAGIGKSSLIKLLLDTSHLSKNTTPPQLACLAEFANFAATCPTNSPSSIIAQLATLQNDRDLLLTLIDTPGLLYHDSNELEAGLHLVLRQIIDSFATSDQHPLAQEQRRDKQIHLCLYLLDPADIVPASTRHLRRPERYGVSPQLTRQRVQLSAMRARANTLSAATGGNTGETTTTTTAEAEEEGMPHYDDSPEDEWGRATVPTSELNILKRLSEYVTVLPIVARADTLTVERLDAVKRAVRRDLMDAGIGLGPFERGERSEDHGHDSGVGVGGANIGAGTAASLNTPPPDTTGGNAPSAARGEDGPLLPYAIMIPDRYHHGDGVLRAGTTARPTHQQYVSRYQHATEEEQDQGQGLEVTATGAFVQRHDLVRTYRWGSINILDPSFSDFLALREAVLGPLVQVLRTRTDEVFYETYRRNVLTDLRHARERDARDARDARPPTTLTRPHSSSTGASASGRSLRPNPPVPPHSLEVYKTNTRSLYPHPQSQGQAINPSSSPYSLAPLASLAPLENPAGGGNVGRQGLPTLTPLSTMLHTSLRYKHSNPTLTSPDDDAPRSPGPSPILPPKHRTGRKVAVACNFCRSRKLKCDGGRPQCLQCIRRTVDCEYEPTAKRRGLAKPSEINAQLALEFRGSSPPSQGQAPNVEGGSSIPPKSVACQFCRARKTRCDGLQPQCSNCKKRNQECVYTYGAGHSEEEGTPSTTTAASAPRRFPPSTVGVTSLPPIQSLPLGTALSDSLPPSSYWHSSSPQLHTALPTRRPHLSPSSRTRSIPGPGQSFPLSRHQHQTESDSLRSFGTFPPPPSGYPTPYTSETRRPSTSGADSQTWRDRSSFSSTSTRGGMSATATPSTPGLKRKASHPGDEEGEGEVIRLGAAGESPSPPKRRRISGGDEAFVSTVAAAATSAERHRHRGRPGRGREEEEEEDSEAAV